MTNFFSYSKNNDTFAQGGGLGIEMIEWEQNSRPKKSQGLSTKTIKIPGPKINAKKSHAEFLTLKILNIKNIRDTLFKHPRRLPLIVMQPRSVIPIKKKSQIKSSHQKNTHFPTQKKSQIQKFQTQKSPSIIPVT